MNAQDAQFLAIWCAAWLFPLALMILAALLPKDTDDGE